METILFVWLLNLQNVKIFEVGFFFRKITLLLVQAWYLILYQAIHSSLCANLCVNVHSDTFLAAKEVELSITSQQYS